MDIPARIVVIGPHPPIRGGIAEVNRELCTLLAKTNTLEVISFSRLYPRFLFSQPHDATRGSEKAPYPVHAKLDSLNPLSWERTAQYILNQHPDRVLFHWWTTFLFPAYFYLSVRLNGKVKMGALVHNTYPHGGSPA